MDLVTIIQSEVSQKEKNQYHLLTHISGIQKNDIDGCICKAEVENKHMDTKWGRRRWNYWEIRIDVDAFELRC